MYLSKILQRLVNITPVILLALLLLGSSAVPPAEGIDQIHAFTRNIEFDYVGWTFGALGVKLNQLAMGISNFMPAEARRQLVLDYLDLVLRIHQTEAALSEIYADPSITNAQAASQELRQQLDAMYTQRDQQAPVAESILQSQISNVTAELGLTLGGQPIPPVLYHASALPWALIVSPRDVIRQDADISLVPDLTIDQHVTLESQVDQTLDVSSLVVGIGGVGVYPTMVQQTSNINWLSEVVAHEWVHNFLSLRPLGLNYFTSPELRTINETTASIAGKEIGRALLERYYPEFAPPPTPEAQTAPTEPPAFDFYKEMGITRVEVDRLLAEGKIEEAEEYMEQRRQVFWENGYRHLRKLNQAYFAFYGAYADKPGGGAAGEDPVGAAVRTLRDQSPTLSDFLNRISWVTSFEKLQRVVEQTAK